MVKFLLGIVAGSGLLLVGLLLAGAYDPTSEHASEIMLNAGFVIVAVGMIVIAITVLLTVVVPGLRRCRLTLSGICGGVAWCLFAPISGTSLMYYFGIKGDLPGPPPPFLLYVGIGSLVMFLIASALASATSAAEAKAATKAAEADASATEVTDAAREDYSEIYGRELTAIEAAIVNAWHTIVGQRRGIYNYPEIPERKVSNAKRAYAQLRPDELIIALRDDGSFGSAKLGFVITTHGVYWRRD